MRLNRVSYMLVACAALAGCSKDTDGEITTLPPLAGLRFVNVVPDVGAVNIRVTDVVGYAPNTVGATFRSAGSPFGLPITGVPMHTAVQAGTRQIRVFPASTDPAVASQILFETTFTFTEGTNYTVYLHGTAAAMQGLLVDDTPPTLGAAQYGIRVLNLAPALTGAPAGAAATSVDLFVTAAGDAYPSGTPTIAGVAAGTASNYAVLATATNQRVLVRGAGAAAAFAQSIMAAGTAGTSTSQPVPGTNVAGTSHTVIVYPRSVPGSPAPQSTPAAVTASIDSVTRSNDTVTVWRAITPATATTCAVAVGAGAAANNLVALTGLGEVEYNGAHLVVAVTAGTNQAGTPATACTGTATPSLWRFRVGGAPASPATGTPSFKVVSPASDFAAPHVEVVVDGLPPRTAP